MEEKTLSQKEAFKGKYLSINVDEVLMSNGKKTTREFVIQQHAACIAALTPENELLFVKQFRYPFKKILLELPAGKLDGNTPIDCAKRELEEETGVIGKNFISLGQLYPTVGYCTEIIYLYMCDVKEFTSQNLDEDEFVSLVKIPLEKAFEMVMNNEIKDAKTQIAVLKLHNIKNNQHKTI